MSHSTQRKLYDKLSLCKIRLEDMLIRFGAFEIPDQAIQMTSLYSSRALDTIKQIRACGYDAAPFLTEDHVRVFEQLLISDKAMFTTDKDPGYQVGLLNGELVFVDPEGDVLVSPELKLLIPWEEKLDKSPLYAKSDYPLVDAWEKISEAKSFDICHLTPIDSSAVKVVTSCFERNKTTAALDPSAEVFKLTWPQASRQNHCEQRSYCNVLKGALLSRIAGYMAHAYHQDEMSIVPSELKTSVLTYANSLLEHGWFPASELISVEQVCTHIKEQYTTALGAQNPTLDESLELLEQSQEVRDPVVQPDRECVR